MTAEIAGPSGQASGGGGGGGGGREEEEGVRDHQPSPFNRSMGASLDATNFASKTTCWISGSSCVRRGFVPQPMAASKTKKAERAQMAR